MFSNEIKRKMYEYRIRIMKARGETMNEHLIKKLERKMLALANS